MIEVPLYKGHVTGGSQRDNPEAPSIRIVTTLPLGQAAAPVYYECFQMRDVKMLGFKTSGSERERRRSASSCAKEA